MEAPAPKPGQMMLWAMQSIAHGADYVSFFRWRTCTMGTEIYWHGILDYDNRDNRKLAEVKKIHQRVEKMKEIIAEQLNCDAESITLETSFKEDLGADSLDLFELVMALEDEYSVEIPSEELQDLTTVGAVVDYLKTKGVEE